MIKYILLILILAFSFVNINAQTVEINHSAPEFSLKDSKGKTVNLKDFQGKTVVLEWVNFDCPFVVKHYSSNNMQKLQKEYTKKGIVWLSICSSAPGKQGNFTPEEINTKIKERNASMTHYLIDEDGKVGRLYGAKNTPNMFVISKEGKIVYMGAIDSIKSTNSEDIDKAENYIKAALDALLSSKEIKTKSTVPYGCSVKY